MTRRTIMGPRNLTSGPIGIYISQPGEDVLNTAKSLLLDTRYDNLKVHYQGRSSLTRGSRTAPPTGAGGNPGYRYFKLGIPFPALPYYPMYTAFLIFRGQNTVWYPPPFPNWDVGNDNTLQIVNFRLYGSVSGQYDLADAGTFQAADEGKYADVDVLFTIYKQPIG